MITLPDSPNEKLLRLEKDVRDLISRSEFHASSSPLGNLVAEIVIGEASPRTTKPLLYVNYSGWVFYVVGEPPPKVPYDPELNTVTSLLVAGIVVSEIFRLRFGNEIVFKPTKGIVGNLGANSAILPSFPDHLDFQGENVSWFGCGSLSYYTVHALDGIKRIIGTLDMIDPSTINPSNSRKYIGLTKKNRGSSKAYMLAQILNDRGISARAFRTSTNEYSNKVDFKIPLAISAMDSSISRRDLQAKLPKTIINAWTGGHSQSLFAGVSRHSFDGIEECLNCAYWTNAEGTPNFVDMAPRLNTNSMTMFEMWREGKSLSSRMMKQEDGMRFLDGYFNACQNFSIRAGSIRREFSIPFISAIGGALLALNLIFEGSEQHAHCRLHGKRITFIMGPEAASLGLEPMAARKNCICNDPVYKKVYSDIWQSV